ncbi:MAG TPA: protein kinase, partial [Pirellulaceae bacterium]|nr:protein kinase [Pirellulaceae bacterium]
RLGNELSPGTATWHELTLDLIWSEIAGSSARLDFPRAEEADYLDRFPEFAEDIRELFCVARELTLAELAQVSRLSQTVLESSTARRERRDASLEFDVSPQRPPPRIGDEVRITERWTVTDELGAGGEKLVFRGRQSDTGREATLKFPRVADKESVARMLGEATTQASIGHPFIPSVFAVSRNAPDQLVLVEQEVRGAPWSAWIGRLDLDENLGVLLKVSLAIAAAHQRSIIHRDIKPSNVMVTVRDRDGRSRADEVALLDWGLAVDVRTARDPDSLTPHKSSAAGRCQGTPLYLAPEMVAMQSDRFQPATDVFLLGAVLYEILTGAPPYSGQTSASRPSGDALVLLGFTRVLRAKVLPAHERVTDRDRVPLELSEIASRAMSRDPARRYRDADEFASALQRQVDHRRAERQSVEIVGRLERLEDEIAVARGRAESLESYVARCQAIVNEFDLAHRFLAADGGESLREACERERRALSRLIDLEIDSGTLELAAQHLDEIATGAHVRIRQLAAGEQEQFRERLASQRAARHRQRVRSALFPAAIVVLILVGLVMVQRENSVAIERERATNRQRIEELRGKALPLFTTAASDRQQSRHHLAALGQARGLAYIDTPAGRAAWMDDVQSSLVPSGISSRREILGSLAFHPDLDYLFAAGRADGQIRAWSLGDDGGAVLFGAHEVPKDTNGFSVVTGLAVRPERTREVLSTGNDGTLRTWRLRFDGNRLRGAEEIVERRFPSAETKWDARLMCLAIEPARVKGPERRIVLGDDSGRVIWINADSRRVIREEKAHKRAVRVVKYLPTRDECVSAAEDGVVNFWRLNGEPIGAIVPANEDGSPLGAEIRSLDISPDGRQMAVGLSTGPIWIWDVSADDVDRRRVVHRLPGHDKSERSVAPTPTTMSLVYSGPRRLLSGGTDGLVREWDTDKGRETRHVTAHADTPQGGPLVRNLAVDLRNGRFASFGIDLATVVWDSESLTPRLRTEGQMAPVAGSIGAFAYAFSRQSDRLVIGSYNFDSLIRTFDTGRLREQQAFQGLTVEPNLSLMKRVSALAINEAGDRIVSAEPDGSLVLWDALRGRSLGRWKSAHKPVQGGRLDVGVGTGILVSALTWSRDGK